MRATVMQNWQAVQELPGSSISDDKPHPATALPADDAAGQETSWAVAESLEWLAQQARAADGLPPGSVELLRLLETPTLRTAAAALEQLADLTPCEEHRATYECLRSALDAAASSLGLTPVHRGGFAERRRQRREQRKQVQSACAALQPFCDPEESKWLLTALQQLPPRPDSPTFTDPSPEHQPQALRSAGPQSICYGTGVLPPLLPARLFFEIPDIIPRIDEALNMARNIVITGRGKSTIAAAALEHVASRFDAVVWLTVQDADHVLLLSQAAESLFPDFEQGLFPSASAGVKYISERLLAEGRTVLLVLDGVNATGRYGRSVIVALNFATREGARVNGSRMIVTVRASGRSATKLLRRRTPTNINECAGAGGPTEFGLIVSPFLGSDSARQMFYLHAFGATDATPPAFVPPEACAELLLRCKGMPLLLRVLGGALGHCASSEEVVALATEVSRQDSDSGPGSAERACAASIAVLPPSLQLCLATVAAHPGVNVVMSEVAHACAALAPLYTPASVRAAERKVQQLVWRGLLCERHPRARRVVYVHDVVRGALCLLGMYDGLSFPRRDRWARRDAALGMSYWHLDDEDPRVRASIQLRAPADRRGGGPAMLQQRQAVVHLRLSTIAWRVIGSDLPKRMLERVRATRGFGAAQIETLDCLGASMHLDLSRCEHLVQLPESIGVEFALWALDLSGCSRLASLPSSIGSCMQLLYLNLSCCRRLCQLPPAIGGCLTLEHLNMHGCSSIVQLPESLGDCSMLRALDLSHCEQLANLPESIGRLTQMTHISLNGCARLAQVPGSIGECAGLRYLDLTGCRSLAQLPESLGDCTGLEGLTVMNCRALAHLPRSLASLAKLHSLYLPGCPVSVRRHNLPPTLAKAAAGSALWLPNPPFGRVTAEWSYELTIKFLGGDAKRVLGNTAIDKVIKQHMRT